jgi:DegV family protein with EDD domain
VPLRIVTDSTADLPHALASELAICVVPVNVQFGEESFRDGVDISSTEFFRRLEQAEQLPTTSQPSAGAFRAAYEALIADGATEILSIHVSEKLSGTAESARQGARGLDGARIEVLDSATVSAALCLAVTHAARCAAAGCSLDDTLAAVRGQLSRTRLLFMVDTLEYLRRGGRIGRARELMGSLLRIKPILEVRDGEVAPLGRARTRRRGIDELLDLAADLRPIEHAMVFDATTPEDREYLADRIRGYAEGAPVIVGTLGPAIGVHAGPGTLGLAVVTSQEPSPPASGP